MTLIHDSFENLEHLDSLAMTINYYLGITMTSSYVRVKKKTEFSATLKIWTEQNDESAKKLPFKKVSKYSNHIPFLKNIHTFFCSPYII